MFMEPQKTQLGLNFFNRMTSPLTKISSWSRSLISRVLLSSLGKTIRPNSSTLRTIPVLIVWGCSCSPRGCESFFSCMIMGCVGVSAAARICLALFSTTCHTPFGSGVCALVPPCPKPRCKRQHCATEAAHGFYPSHIACGPAFHLPRE